MTDSRATQRSKILQLLTAARGAWVPLPQIVECAAQYNARIFELRRMGFRIPAPRSKIVDGQKHTWYRIDLSTDTAAADLSAVLSPSSITFPEFGSLAPESYGVD